MNPIDELIIRAIRKLARRRGWSFRNALRYVVLCDAITQPALLTVPNLFAAPDETPAGRAFACAYLRTFMEAWAQGRTCIWSVVDSDGTQRSYAFESHSRHADFEYMDDKGYRVFIDCKEYRAILDVKRRAPQ